MLFRSSNVHSDKLNAGDGCRKSFVRLVALFDSDFGRANRRFGFGFLDRSKVRSKSRLQVRKAADGRKVAREDERPRKNNIIIYVCFASFSRRLALSFGRADGYAVFDFFRGASFKPNNGRTLDDIRNEARCVACEVGYTVVLVVDDRGCGRGSNDVDCRLSRQNQRMVFENI